MKRITMAEARQLALKTMADNEQRRSETVARESKCSFCHGGPHTLGGCPACSGDEVMGKEIKRLNNIIRRASVRFFEDGISDGETAAVMLKILDEAKQPAAIAGRDMVAIGGDDNLV